ncbi:MAG TPA: glutamine amidotransferase, partial [Phycisphaerae bacterium]
DLPPPAKVSDVGHTNIARALRLAMATFPADRQKRVVLFSDGNQNQEDALREARIAGLKDVDVDVVPILAQHGHEIMVDQVIVPPHVRKDARFLVRALVTSDTAQDVEVIVSRDGAPYTRIPAERLRAGSNVIDVPDALSDGGAHQYQFTIVPKNPDADTFAANNTGYALTQVDAPGRVLLIPGKSNDPTFLYNALRESGVQVVKANPGGLPATPDELAAYDCVIMDNVNYHDVQSAPQMNALKHWVEDYGGGLVLVGGDDSFGPGGYLGTTLEELSPVEMDVKRQKHLASLAVVVVLDKSGSMGMPVDVAGRIEKMQLANEGACQVANLLDGQDLAMLGVCDTEVRWVDDLDHCIPMNPGNKSRLQAGIRSVRAGGGGIDCATALFHSYDMIKPAQTMTKHVIMFGDAADCDEQEGCVDMAADMYRRFGITTSVIGMGTPADKDAPFEEAVAKAGHGRFFITEDVNNLPRIFMKEAFLVSRQAFIEDKNGIKLTPYNSPLLQGFISQNKAQLPPIYGYIGTTLKPRATLALHGKQADDPVLAHWVIGLGKCVAYTSDSSSRWGKDFVSWDGYSKFWSQVVRWVSRSPQNNGLTTTTLIEGSDGRVLVDALDPDGKPINNLQLQASVISPDQTTASDNGNLTLEQIAPGRYQGHFAANQRGTYLVAVSQGADGNQQLVSTSGGILSFPQEYRDLQPNVALLKNLAETSGGIYLSDVKNLFEQKPNPVHTFWPLWQMLLMLVTSLLFVDIAWRRLNVADWFRPRNRAPEVVRTDAGLGALRSIRTGRQEVDSQHKSMRDRVEARAAAEPTVAVQVVTQDLAAEQTGFSAGEPKNEGAAKDAAPPENYANRLMSAKKR